MSFIQGKKKKKIPGPGEVPHKPWSCSRGRLGQSELHRALGEAAREGRDREGRDPRGRGRGREAGPQGSAGLRAVMASVCSLSLTDGFPKLRLTWVELCDVASTGWVPMST